jgi:hypothetical protein
MAERNAVVAGAAEGEIDARPADRELETVTVILITGIEAKGLDRAEVDMSANAGTLV